MIIQERDKELIRWVNGFGFVDIEAVSKRWGVVYETARARLRKLVDAGLLSRERVLVSVGYVFRVTKEGAELAGDDLSPVKSLKVGTFEHDLAVLHLAITLEHETCGSFEAERRLRRRLGLSGVGVPGHVPDGLLSLPSANKPVAIEVEFSAKPRARLRQIIEQYRATFDYSGVWYYAGTEGLEKTLREATGGDDLFKIERIASCKGMEKLTAGK